VDVFLYFVKSKNPGKKLWMSFNGVAERVLMSLFQQSYKGFKGKFFKICCSKFDPTLLDLALQDREVCEFFSNLGAVFSTEELTNDVVDAYATGFVDAMAQVACVHPRVDLSQTGLSKKIVGGQFVNAKE